MNTINLNNKKYYLADDIITTTPQWCKGVRNGRELVRKKKIGSKYFIYARIGKDGEWSKNKGKSVKYDKVLVRVIHLKKIDDFMDELKNGAVDENDGLAYAPDILELDDAEKFHDADGNAIEIETRGTRTVDDIYFRVKDVARAFDMEHLEKVIMNAKTKYIINIHHVFFLLDSRKRFSGKQVKNKHLQNKPVRELFLTYEGILRALFVSYNNKTTGFLQWATTTLFTAHLGTKDQKIALSSELLGVPAKQLKEIFKKSSASIPCVYRFSIGKAKELRQSMSLPDDIPDTSIIIKYGFTEDLARRLNEHIKTYGSIKGSSLELMNYSYIDPKYLSAAEKNIKDFFNDLEKPIVYKKHVELVAVDPRHEDQIRARYKHLSTEYSGCVKTLVDKISTLETENIILKKDNEFALSQKDIALLQKDVLIEQKESENNMLKKEIAMLKKEKDNELTMLKKDLEIAMLKQKCFQLEQ